MNKKAILLNAIREGLKSYWFAVLAAAGFAITFGLSFGQAAGIFILIIGTISAVAQQVRTELWTEIARLSDVRDIHGESLGNILYDLHERASKQHD